MPRYHHDETDRLIGRRIKARRKALGLTLEQLGRGLGVSYQQIQKYEAGRNQISAALLLKISTLLSVPVSYFFSDRDDKDGMASTPISFAPSENEYSTERISFHYSEVPKGE